MQYIYSSNRKAIAMIELIFAIVIMGIVMLSAPMMLSTATKSSTVAFQQESIAMIASHTNTLMTYAWDEQNTISQNHEDEIINTVSGVISLSTRAGIANRSRELNATINASPAGTFGGKDRSIVPGSVPPLSITEDSRDDVDDFDGNTTSLSTVIAGNSADEGEYMDKSITMTTNIKYIADDTTDISNYGNCAATVPCHFGFNPLTVVALTSTRNIKLITTDLNSTNTQTAIKLHSFVCNIGSFSLDSVKK